MMNRSYSAFSKVPFILCVWWLFWFLIQVGLLIYSGQEFQTSLVDAAISISILALSGIVLMNVLRNYNPNYSYRFFHLLLGIALSAISISAFKFIINQFFPSEVALLNFIETTLAIRFVFTLLMNICLIIILWFWFDQKEKTSEQLRESHADDLLKKAELANLKQQMQPHFLFNSLNSINALIGSDPKKARQMIQQLSDFLRGTLKKDDHQLVRLEEEIVQLNLYLEIEKVRFGYRLETEINVSASAKVALLPPLLLQPIVENAIKFGLYDTTEKIKIKLSAETKDHYLFFQVENPYDSETSSSSKGTGFGLHSITRRLYLIFGRNDLLSIKAENNIFITQIKIPQQDV